MFEEDKEELVPVEEAEVEEIELELEPLEEEEEEEAVEETPVLEAMAAEDVPMQMVSEPVKKVQKLAEAPQTLTKYKLIRDEKPNKVHKYMGKTKRY